MVRSICAARLVNAAHGCVGTWYRRCVEAEAELLRRWGERDRKAGNALFQRYFAPMHRFFVNKVRDAATVQDLVQETFTRLAASASTFGGRSTVRTFVFGVARLVLFEHYRERVHFGLDVIGETSVADLGAGPSSVAAAREELRLLLDALRQIPFDKQILLELYYFESFSGPELSVFLNVSENTARSRLRCAMEALRDVIRRHGPNTVHSQSLLADIEGWVRELQEALGVRERVSS